MMTLSPIESALRDFLVEHVFVRSGVTDLGPDEMLLGRKPYDSIAIAQVVAFCEAAFGVSIPDDEVLPEHFESVRAIARLVDRLRASRP